MDALAEIRGIYFDECDEFTGLLEGYLAAMAEGRASSEDINGAFRAVHSIKGGAGAFGLSDLVAFAHRFEACLDSLRSGRVSVESAPIATLLQAGDVLSTLITAARDGSKLDVEPALIAALEAFGGAPPTTRPSEFDIDFGPRPSLPLRARSARCTGDPAPHRAHRGRRRTCSAGRSIRAWCSMRSRSSAPSR